MHITSVRFDHFKAFTDYLVRLESMNILVGPNNSGKSTVIGAFRALAAGLRLARHRRPERITVGEDDWIGYRLPETVIPISLISLWRSKCADYVSLSNGNRLDLEFPGPGQCILVPRPRGTIVTTRARFRAAFPIEIAVVPVLGPVEHREILRERDTVVRGLSTHGECSN